jgi:hypothetical protein
MIGHRAKPDASATIWQRLDIYLSRCDMLAHSSAGLAQATQMSKSKVHANRRVDPGGPSDVRTEPFDATWPKDIA